MSLPEPGVVYRRPRQAGKTAEAFRDLPGIIGTQYAVRSPWGIFSYDTQKKAESAVANMRLAGHDATLIWRGVTEWQVSE